MSKDEKIRRKISLFITTNKENKRAKSVKREVVKLANQTSTANVLQLIDDDSRNFFDEITLDLSSMEK